MSALYDNLKCVGANMCRDRKTGMYYARVKIHGKTHRQPLHTADRRLAEQHRDKWLSQVRANPPRSNWKDITFRGMADLLVEEKKSLTPNTDDRHVADALKPVLEQCPWRGGAEAKLSRITPSDLKLLFLGQKGTDGKRRGGLAVTDPRQPEKIGEPFSASWYNHCVLAVRHLFAKAKLDGYRVDDPMEQACIPMRRDEKIIRLTPSVEEFKAIVDCVRSNPYNHNAEVSADMIEIAGYCGLGNAEVESVTFDMINYVGSDVDLKRKKTQHEFDIPVYPWAIPTLNRILARAEAPGGSGTAPGTKLFAIKMPVRALEAACKKLEIGHFTPTAIRRMFIYQCAWAGVPVEIIAKLQGHQDNGKLIRKIYDDAICVCDIERTRDKWREIMAHLEKAKPAFDVAEADLQKPQNTAPILKVNSTNIGDPALQARLAAIKADFAAKWKRTSEALNASRSKLIQPNIHLVQPELVSLAKDVAGVVSAAAMRKIKSDKFNAKIDALIAAGKLDAVYEENRLGFNAAQNAMRAIELYIEHVGFDGVMDLLQLQLDEFKARRAVHETLLRQLAIARKRVLRQKRNLAKRGSAREQV